MKHVISSSAFASAPIRSTTKDDACLPPSSLALFFLSALFLFTVNLLYAWGDPIWIGRIPYVACFRFLDSLGAYFLGSVCFFLAKLAFKVVGKNVRFRDLFVVSFIPVPVFAALCLSNASLQTLKTSFTVYETAMWFVFALFFTRVIFGGEKSGAFRKLAAICLCFVLVCLITGIALLFSVSQAVPLLLLRLAVLAALWLAFFSLSASGRQPSTVSSGPVRPASAAFPDAAYGLSPREIEVLALLLEGRTNEETAEALFISLSTVKTHVASLFRKTGSRNRLELAARCGERCGAGRGTRADGRRL